LGEDFEIDAEHEQRTVEAAVGHVHPDGEEQCEEEQGEQTQHHERVRLLDHPRATPDRSQCDQDDQRLEQNHQLGGLQEIVPHLDRVNTAGKATGEAEAEVIHAPARDHGIIETDRGRNPCGPQTHPSEFLAAEHAEGAHRSRATALAHREFCDDQRNRPDEQEEKPRNQECAAAIGADHARESPDVASANRSTDRCENQTPTGGELVTLSHVKQPLSSVERSNDGGLFRFGLVHLLDCDSEAAPHGACDNQEEQEGEHGVAIWRAIGHSDLLVQAIARLGEGEGSGTGSQHGLVV